MRTDAANRAWYKKLWDSPWLGAAIIVVLTVATYFPALKAGFIWDDDQHLTQNPCVIGPLGLKDIWTSRAARICPLVQTTFWLEHKLWGLEPLPYHVVNVIVHGLCGVVLWRVLLSLGIRGAWLGAALWALHPVQVETAAWITELKNTQSCLFFLLAILFFVKWKKAKSADGPARGQFDYALAMLCAALAMASKSSTVILPVVLGLCSWWIDGRWRWRTVPRLLPVCLMSIAASALSVWTQNLEGANNPAWGRSGLERIIVPGKVVWFYLGKLFWPHPLIFIYPRWKIDASQLTSYLPTIAVCAVLGIFWWYRNDRLRPAFFAFGYFIAALLPVLGLIDHYFLRYSFVGDHFQYLASMGLLALAASGLLTFLGAFDNARAWLQPAVCGALLLGLAALTARQVTMYRDVETLWRTTIARNPDCPLAHLNLGVALKEQGKTADAETHYREALRLNPTYAEALNNVGGCQAEKGQMDEAITTFWAAFESNPNYALASYNLGKAFVAEGKDRQGDYVVRSRLADAARLCRRA